MEKLHPTLTPWTKTQEWRNVPCQKKIKNRVNIGQVEQCIFLSSCCTLRNEGTRRPLWVSEHSLEWQKPIHSHVSVCACASVCVHERACVRACKCMCAQVCKISMSSSDNNRCSHRTSVTICYCGDYYSFPFVYPSKDSQPFLWLPTIWWHTILGTQAWKTGLCSVPLLLVVGRRIMIDHSLLCVYQLWCSRPVFPYCDFTCLTTVVLLLLLFLLFISSVLMGNTIFTWVSVCLHSYIKHFPSSYLTSGTWIIPVISYSLSWDSPLGLLNGWKITCAISQLSN